MSTYFSSPLRRVPLTVVCALAVGGATAASADAAVTAAYDPSEQSVVVTGTSGSDTITVGCDAAGHVEVNGVDVPSGFCAGVGTTVSSFHIDAKAGQDTIDMTAMSAGSWDDFNLTDRSSFDGGADADVITLAKTPAKSVLGNNDLVDGGSGNDTIDAGFGDDSITGGIGADTIEGGAGDDEFTEAAAGGAIWNGSSLILASGIETVTGVEKLTLTGSDANETFGLATFPGRTSIHALGGADVISGTAYVDYLFGGTGDDVISGNGHNDLISGDAGADTLHGGAGSDTIFGGTKGAGPSKDTITGDGDHDIAVVLDSTDGTTVQTGGGDDVILATNQAAITIDGGPGADMLSATGTGVLTSSTFGAASIAGIEHARVDETLNFDAHAFGGSTELKSAGGAPAKLIGGQGPNTISGGKGSGGADVLIGGPSADEIQGGESGPDVITGGGGADILTGSPGAAGDRLVEVGVGSATVTSTKLDLFAGPDDELAGFEVVELTGTGGPDVIDAAGFSGRAVLRGGGGDDTLTGTSKADTLDAGTGVDTLRGLDGGDTFLARNGEQTSLDCGTGNDIGERDAIDTTTGCEGVLAPPLADNGKTTAPDTANPGGGTTAGGNADQPLQGGPDAPLQGTTTAPAPVAVSVSVTSRALRARRGTVRVTVDCVNGPCNGELVLRSATGRKAVLARGELHTTAGAKRTVTLKLSAVGAKLVRKAALLRIRVTAKVDGQSRTIAATLRAAK